MNRAFIDSTLIHIYKKEYDQHLMIKNPIRRCLRMLVSKDKELLSFVFKIPVIRYNKHSPKNDQTNQMNLFITHLEHNPIWYASSLFDLLLFYRNHLLNKQDFVKYVSQINNNNIKQLLIQILNSIDKHKYVDADSNTRKRIILDMYKWKC